jgi:hypothetical protein
VIGPTYTVRSRKRPAHRTSSSLGRFVVASGHFFGRGLAWSARRVIHRPIQFPLALLFFLLLLREFALSLLKLVVGFSQNAGPSLVIPAGHVREG